MADPKLRKKVTSDIYFQRQGTTGYARLSNALLQKIEPKIEQTQIMQASGGLLSPLDEQPAKYEPRFSLKLDEHSGPALALLHLATPSGSATLPGAASADVQLIAAPWTVAVMNKSFFTGSQNLNWERLKTNGVDWVRGVDYQVDEGSGLVTILTTGTADYAHDIVARFSSNDTVAATYTMMDSAWVRGECRLVERNLLSGEADEIKLFVAELRVADRGEFTPDKFNEFMLELLVLPEETTQSL